MTKLMSQRDKMRELVRKHGRNKNLVCVEYAKAETAGLVRRDSNSHRKTALEYAEALYSDGDRKGWF